MSTPRWLISRRTMLRGLGVAMALPLLDVMIPPRAYGNDYKVVPTKMPVRYSVLYIPNGLIPKPTGNHDQWTPKEGPLSEKLPDLLSPLEKVKADLLVLSGMHNELPLKTPGHFSRTTGFLCSSLVHGGGQPSKDRDDNLDSGGISIDQLMANSVGVFTKLPSLEIALDEPIKGFVPSTGENKLYGSYLSWSSPTTPVSPEIDPKAVFDRLFRSEIKTGSSEKALPISAFDDQCVLDAVLSNLSSFRRTVSNDDLHKLDEYTTSVRDLEKRLEREVKAAQAPRRIDPLAMRALPELDKHVRTISQVGLRGDTPALMRAMMDVLILAYWTDTTRISTFNFGNEISRRNFSFLNGVSGDHHSLSHHSNNKETIAQYVTIIKWYLEQCAYFIERLGQIKEGNDTLLDNSMILFGGGIRDGNVHDGRNLPIVLAGRGGGTVKTGRHINTGMGTPLANLHVELARRMGIQIDQFADSNGPIRGLL